ncbi:MAG: prenyltransferase [Halieaceae bacterium]|nr:prenyltransferase [Halieaceae bacterium]
MSGLYLSRGLFPHDFLRPTVEFILRTQQESGEIPWFEGGYSDPWDHVEAAMGLSVGGEYEAALKAYRWLVRTQLEDGSWWAGYRGAEVDNGERRETNFVAYFATGVWHHFLITGDRDFLLEMWPTLERAIDFVVALQTRHGDILWAVDANNSAKDDALLTGCSSIYKSLECAHNIAVTLEQSRPRWLAARTGLGAALRHKPERFDRTWESKARYSMDWFYPVLTGVLPKREARARLAGRWDEFVEQDLGCRCVADEPWVTVAETCELVLALLAADNHAQAVQLYSWLQRWRLDDGSYWTGYQFAQDLRWPDEKPTWTAAAILLAADALTEYTPASRLFRQVQLLDFMETDDRWLQPA